MAPVDRPDRNAGSAAGCLALTAGPWAAAYCPDGRQMVWMRVLVALFGCCVNPGKPDEAPGTSQPVIERRPERPPQSEALPHEGAQTGDGSRTCPSTYCLPGPKRAEKPAPHRWPHRPAALRLFLLLTVYRSRVI